MSFLAKLNVYQRALYFAVVKKSKKRIEHVLEALEIFFTFVIQRNKMAFNQNNGFYFFSFYFYGQS